MFSFLIGFALGYAIVVIDDFPSSTECSAECAPVEVVVAVLLVVVVWSKIHGWRENYTKESDVIFKFCTSGKDLMPPPPLRNGLSWDELFRCMQRRAKGWLAGWLFIIAVMGVVVWY